MSAMKQRKGMTGVHGTEVHGYRGCAPAAPNYGQWKHHTQNIQGSESTYRGGGVRTSGDQGPTKKGRSSKKY